MNENKEINLKQQLGIDFSMLDIPIKNGDFELYRFEKFYIGYNVNSKEWLVYM
jgi:hypothetical protein